MNPTPIRCGLSLGVALALAAAASDASAQAGPESCVTCHLALGDERLTGPAQQYATDVHAAKGLGCVACHGGDGTAEGPEAMDPAKGFAGAPARSAIPAFCGRCHANAEFMKRYNPALRVDQLTEYASSVHGQLLRRGDQRVATCTSCHPAHRIRPPSDPLSSVHPLRVVQTCGSCHGDSAYMAPYGIPTDQPEKYRQSVHWEALSVRQDLSAPTCNDCHGNHGAAPPGVSWVGNTCGQCHSVQADLFARSLHAELFPLMGLPGCVACHGNHDIRRTDDTMLGLDTAAVCTRCHSPDTPSGEQVRAMRALIDSLRRRIDSAGAMLTRAERAGVEVSQAQFELESARTALITARAAVHAFALAAVAKEVEAGLPVTDAALARGREALDELRFRRTGLAVSVLIILALITGLVLKIRQLERQGVS
ncbi:MAG TPA: cytochrome c3 family protein [Gemmatimonadales bacterium]|nr:cytochrome c3 family protein [Gemmatimonadales bacterium]